MRTGGKTGGKRSAEPRVPPPPPASSSSSPFPHSNNNNPSQQQQQQRQQQQLQQQQRRQRPEDKTPTPHKLDLCKFRSLVRSYVDRGHYETAIFWADKIATLSGGDPKDVYWMAYALYQSGQYHRAAHLIQSREQLFSSYLALRFLAGKCFWAAKEWQRAIEVLQDPSPDVTAANSSSSSSASSEALRDLDEILQTPVNKLVSSISCLRGQAYEALENRSLAATHFRLAIVEDVFNFEAFDLLVTHHMLTAEEEAELLLSLPFKEQCGADEAELLRFLYEHRLKKYDKPAELLIPPSLETLDDNLDVVVNLAERHYYNCDVRETHRISAAVLKKDPYHSTCLPLHIAVLVELNKSNDLFYLAHNLVDIYPGKAVAWFAVGCYYMLVNKHETARRFLSKSTSLDRVYGPAWLAFGHSFAAENEHDQAMAAYFTASQVMRGCHLPILYIGLEYGLTNNPKLAERFFNQALNIAPSDPFVLHEMGVIYFQNGDYVAAERFFKEAFDKVHEVSSDVSLLEKWEPLLTNLGHVSRKLKKYGEALDFHQKALVLSPLNPSTLSAIGFVHLLMFDASQAVDYFHKALGIRRDDTFSTAMLEQALEMMLADLGPCDGENIPPPEDVLLPCVPPRSGGRGGGGGGGGGGNGTSMDFGNLKDEDSALFRSLRTKDESHESSSSTKLSTNMEDASTVSMDLQ